MTPAQTLTIRASEIRAKLNELAGVEELTDEQRQESDGLTVEYRSVETKLRAAIVGEASTETTGPTAQDAEHRERIELRGRATFGRYLSAALRGRQPDGAEAEYAAAVGVHEAGHVPLMLFEAPAGGVEFREDAATPAPTVVGVNLQSVQPAIFAASIAGRLGITMPSVASGTYSIPRITTSLTAGPKAKGAAQESTAAALTVIDAKPRRISARLSLTAEDIASVGTASFESALRQNLTAVLSEQYDLQCLTGDGVAPNVNGLLAQMTAPTAPAAVADFDAFAAAAANAIDGLWAAEVGHVGIVAGVKAYRLSAATFRGTDGEMSAASYMARESGGWWTNARMPEAPDSGAGANVEAAIVHRRGRTGLTTAEHPVWDSIAIDDVYSDSGSATRHFSLHVLVGDRVLLVQPDAYARIAFKVA